MTGSDSALPPLTSKHDVPEAGAPQSAGESALFPQALRGSAVAIPGAHGVAFDPRGRELVTFHGFGVVGVARWSVGPLRPRRWLKRPLVGGTMRQVAWDRDGKLWLVTSSYSPRVHVHTPRGDRFAAERVLRP